MVDLDEVKTSEDTQKSAKFPRFLEDVSVSKNGSTVAVAASNLTGRLWNGAIGICELNSIQSQSQAQDVIQNSVETDAGCTCIDWVPDNRLIVGSDNGALDVWSWDKEKQSLTQQMALMEHHDTCSCLSYNASLNQVLTGSWDKSIKIWDLSVEMSINTFNAHFDRVLSVGWSEVEPNLLLSASLDGRVIVYDNNKAKPASIVSSNQVDYPTSVKFHPSDRNIIGIGDCNGDMKVLDLRNLNEPLFSKECHTKNINKIVFISKSSELIATCADDCNLVVTNWKDGSTRLNTRCHSDYIQGLSWNARVSSLVSCAWDGSLAMPFKLEASTCTDSPMEVDAK